MKNTLLLTAVSAISLFSLEKAYAQTAVAVPEDTASQVSIPEIVVTAQRKEQNQQDIPISISALNANALEDTNIQSGLDLQKLVPSLLIQQNNGGVTTFLRGIGNNQVSVGNEAENAVYIDGVYYNRLTAALLRLNNLERTEVLEGPQGTLFGRNATGGLIQYITRTPEPGSSPTVDASIGYGTFNTRDFNVYAASGFGEKIAGDIAVDYYDEPGFGHNVYDGSLDNFDYSTAVRTKWVFKLSDDTKITASGSYSHMYSDQGLTAQYPGSPIPGQGNTGLPVTGGLLPRLDYWDRNVDSPIWFRTTSYDTSVRIEHDFHSFNLVDIVAYHDEKESFIGDSDYTPQFSRVATLPAQTELFTNELQLLSEKSSFVDWSGGLFYLNTHQGYDTATLAGPGFGVPSGGSLQFTSNEPVKSYAVYGQATVPVYEDLKLTLGARESEDDIKANGLINLYLNPAGPAIPAVPYASAEHTEREFSFKTALSDQIQPGVMTYASVSRGYKAGLYSLLTFDPTYIAAEVLTAYEIGAKAEFFNSRLRINPALFYYKDKNPQTEIIVDGLPALINAGGLKSEGVEVKSDFAITSQLSGHLNAAYIDARYTDYNDAPFFSPGGPPFYGLLPAVTGNATGNRPPQAPLFSGDVGLNYSNQQDYGKWSTSVNYSYNSSFFWSPDDTFRQNAYGLLDAQVSLAIARTGLTIKLWGSNLTGARYATQGYEGAGPNGDLGAPGSPRQAGVTFRYHY